MPASHARRARSSTIVRLAAGLVAALLPAGLVLAPTTGSAAPARVTTAAASAGSAGAGDSYLPRAGNGGYDVRRYDLAVRYNPRSDRMRGTATIRAVATKALSRFDLDLVGLTVSAVSVDGRPARWNRKGQELVVAPARALRAKQVFRVVVRYGGKPRSVADDALGRSGVLTTSDGAIAVGQPASAAYWFPVNDHPSDKALFAITLTVPKGLQAISNGLPSATRTRDGWSTTRWTVRHPMASYLAFMAVGRFEVRRWTTASGLPVIDAVDPAIPSAVKKAIRGSLARQGTMIAAASRWFGPYPFEAAGAVVDRGGMSFALENQTRPTYATSFWGTADDAHRNDEVVMHELAHQWFGDSVSVERWRDIWLNEGFATYAEWLWNEHEGQPAPDAVFDAMMAAMDADDPAWGIRLDNPGRADSFHWAVYLRGALTLQALREEIGDADFFTLLRTWARRHRDGNVTTADFVRLSEQVSGRQLDTFFAEWVSETDKPTNWSR